MVETGEQKGAGGGSEPPVTAEDRTCMKANFCGFGPWPSYQRCQSVTSWQGIRLLCELSSVVSLGGGRAGAVEALCFVLF